MRRIVAVLSTALLVVPSSPAVAASNDTSLPPHGERDPAGTTITAVDGTNVVLQYGDVVPSFDGWSRQEPTRQYRPLDGRWRFRFDPDGTGETAGWQLPGISMAGWDQITVPSAWDLKDQPGFGGYDGTGFGTGTAFADGYAWYRTTVTVPADWRDRTVRLNFLAVNYRADVWVNGRYAGAHEGGHTPFALDVGDALRPGPVTIAVRVHRRASFTDYTTGTGPVSDPLAVPWKPVDYWPYAGITRSVWLESVPRVAVAKVLVAAQDGHLDARAVVTNHGSRTFGGSVLVDPGNGSGAKPAVVPVSVPAGGVAVAKAELAIPSAPVWSPASPRTLLAKAQLREGSRVADQLTTSYGVRSVATDGSALEVNGSPVFLKGLNWHEESAEHGRAMTRAEYDRELGQARGTGANLLRNTVYNRHPYVYQWADRNGVFVMDDIDNMWMNTAQEKVQTEQYGLSRALATTMAWNQHNNPSVILWCLENESEIDGNGAPVYRAWLQDMKDAVKAVDLQDRPVTWASNTTADPAFDIADVIGFNEYFGYFYGRNEDLGPAIDGVHATYPDKPIVITENGTWAIPGTHGPDTEQGTEEWQAASMRSHWDQTTARKDYVAGYVYWLLKDYKQRMGYNEEYNGISVMGMLAFDGTTRKLVYDAYRDARMPR